MKITKDGKQYGEIVGDTYISHRQPHNFFRIFKGFGVSVWVLNLLKDKGINKIKIIYHGATDTNEFDFSVTDYFDSPNNWDYSGEKEKIVSIDYSGYPRNKIKAEKDRKLFK